MFAVESDHEQIFEEPSMLFEQPKGNYVNLMDDLLADHFGGLEDKGMKKLKRSINEVNKINDAGSSEAKKMMHRDIEKQRRKEMAALYTSLRSLLPLEYIKGKRAACDHMEQAVNYINDTQKKIEEMKVRRNKLKKCVDDSVKVNFLGYDGMEILITTAEECFPLSKVLEYLLGLELSVTTCEFTRSHQYSLHKLYIELDEIKRIDISELQQRLVNLIKVS